MEKRRKIDSIFGDFNEKFLENRDSVGDIVDGIIERATYNNFIEEDQGSINSARYISDDFQTQCAVMTKCVIKSPFLDKALGWNLFKTVLIATIPHSYNTLLFSLSLLCMCVCVCLGGKIRYLPLDKGKRCLAPHLQAQPGAVQRIRTRCHLSGQGSGRLSGKAVHQQEQKAS